MLDIDLDAFVQPVEHWADANSRLDPVDYTPWPVTDALSWLRDRCHLSGPLPGWSVEHHVEVFDRWRDAIDVGVLRHPFHVTHVDAHADLGLGASGYVHLLSDVVHRPLEARAHPNRGETALNSATYLSYAIGCRWVTDIDYVFCPGGGSDILAYLMEDFDPHGDTIRLPVLTDKEVDGLIYGPKPVPTEFEPRVPLRSTRMADFAAPAGYDVICLCRSPDYTPPTADPLYEAIRDAFISGVP